VTMETSSEPAQTGGVASQTSSMGRLLLISLAALYLEIVLIRWLGTEVKIFAFFQNLSLIVCFLGFGVGCFSSSKRGSVLPSLAAITTLVVAVSLPFKPWHDILQTMSSVLSFTTDAQLWGTIRVASSSYYQFLAVSLLIVSGFMLLLVMIMIPLGRWIGYYLETASNTVTAYSVNLLGSLAGIWLLAILAFLWLSPPYWFTVAFVLILLAQPFSWRSTLIACALLAITLFALRPANGNSVYWSPYQKLTVTDIGNQQYMIDVNNEGYMSIANVTPGFMANNPQLASIYKDSSYDSPFQFAKSANRVLVVGSGAGNDVAAALRHGAAQVDAVEIDPLISTLGMRLHPEQPYASPKVHLITNDARNFMRQCQTKYDIIIFGLLDSHTEFSGYSNMRVDNYVYTEESFREAQRLLSPDGILVLKFEVRQPWTWIGQRFYSMLSHIFPHPPLTYYSPQMGALAHATVFIESNSSSLWEESHSAEKSAFLSSRPPVFPLTLDNAPPPHNGRLALRLSQLAFHPASLFHRVRGDTGHGALSVSALFQLEGNRHLAVLSARCGISADGDSTGKPPRLIFRNNLAGELHRSNRHSHRSAFLECLCGIQAPRKPEHLLCLFVRNPDSQLCDPLEPGAWIGNICGRSDLRCLLRTYFLCGNHLH